MGDDTTYNFIVPDANVARDIDRGDFDWTVFNDGRYCWTALTYLRLRNRLPRVRLSARMQPDCVNVIHPRTVHRARRNCFVVVCQADWPRIPWGHAHIVQNRDMVADRNTFWITHWPQYGMLRRGDRSGDRLLVGYMGRVHRASDFEELRHRLGSAGIQLVLRGEGSWNDYSDLDVVISHRTIGRKLMARKPPTKLVNAWLAGVPFVAMDEPAFRQVGKSGVDYIAVDSLDELVGAVLKLREDPVLYRRLVENGRLKVGRYSWDAIALRWVDVLEGPIRQRFKAWNQRPVREALRFSLLHGLWTVDQRLRRWVKRAARSVGG